MARLRSEQGVTLIELLLAVVILGLIAVPLTASVIVGLKTTDKTQKALDDGAASDLLSMYLAPDVQNANPSAPLSTGSADCRGGGSTAELVFNDAAGLTSYAVEQVNGKPALVRRAAATGCARQVIAPGLASGYQLNGGTATPSGAPLSGTLHLYCGSIANECTGGYANLKMVTIALTTGPTYSVTLRATTRT